MTRRWVLGGAAGAMLVLGVVAPAGTAVADTPPSWGTAVDLSDPNVGSNQQQVAVSSNGSRAVAVWKDSGGANPVIQAAAATIVGNAATWSTPTALTAIGQDAEVPQVAISANGTRATAVWRRRDGSNFVIQAMSATISGNEASWGSVTTLSATGQDAEDPQIDLSNDGTKATVVWARNDGSTPVIQSKSATISGSTASWGAVATLSASGQTARIPQVAVSTDGTRATAVWGRNNGSQQVVQSASAAISGNAASWGTVSDLSSPASSADNPQIAVSSNGSRATAIWFRPSSGFLIETASATIDGAAATWGSATALSESGQNAFAPQVDVSGDGALAVAVWMESVGPNYLIRSAVATIDGTAASWGAAASLSTSGQSAEDPQVGLAADGSAAIAAWRRFDGAVYVAQGATATITGGAATWAAATDLSATNRNAVSVRMGVASTGTAATVIWSHTGASNPLVQSVSYGGITELPPGGADTGSLVAMAGALIGVGIVSLAAGRRRRFAA